MPLTCKAVSPFLMSYKLVVGAGGGRTSKKTWKATDQRNTANKHAKMFKFLNNKWMHYILFITPKTLSIWYPILSYNAG